MDDSSEKSLVENFPNKRQKLSIFIPSDLVGKQINGMSFRVDMIYRVAKL